MIETKSWQDLFNQPVVNPEVKTNGSFSPSILKVPPKATKKDLPKIKYVIPAIYQTELKYSFFMACFWFSLLTAMVMSCLVLLILFLTYDPWNDYSKLYLLSYLPLGAFLSYKAIANFYLHHKLKLELKHLKPDPLAINIPINMQKLFLKLKVAYLNLNWFGFLLYVILGLTMLISAIAVIFCANPHLAFGDFTTADSLGYIGYGIVFYLAMSLMICLIVYHVCSLISNHLRTERIMSFYQHNIVDKDELIKLKRHINIRNFIITLIVLGLIPLLVWLMFKFFKKKPATSSIIVKH